MVLDRERDGKMIGLVSARKATAINGGHRRKIGDAQRKQIRALGRIKDGEIDTANFRTVWPRHLTAPAAPQFRSKKRIGTLGVLFVLGRSEVQAWHLTPI